MVLDEIATVLVTAGVGTVTPASTRSIFKTSAAKVPDGDGPYISLTEYGGAGPKRVHNSRAANFQFPSVQIITRAVDPVAAMVKARAAYDALIQVVNQTISGVFYLQIMPQQEPYDLGLDSTGRRRQVVFNVMVMKRP